MLFYVFLYMRKSTILKILFLIIILVTSCENCPTSSEDLLANTIFFNTKPLNTEMSKIYSISTGSTNLKHRGDGLVYSAPSKDFNLAILETNENNIKELYLKNIKNGKKTLLLRESATIKIQKPVISPQSEYISYQGDGRQLFIFPFNEQISYLISNSFLTNSIPSFSPNGEYLAFFEKHSEFTSTKLKVIKSNSSGEEVYSYLLDYELPAYSSNYHLNWSADSKIVIFSSEIHSELHTINLCDVIEKKVSSIPIDFVGVINPAISINNEYFAFTGKNGNIYLYDYKDENAIPEVLVEKKYINEFCDNPLFSKDNNVILYSRYGNSEMLDFSANLEIVDIKSREISLLMNNIQYAFWNLYAK